VSIGVFGCVLYEGSGDFQLILSLLIDISKIK
jgi:hypothetical protein